MKILKSVKLKDMATQKGTLTPLKNLFKMNRMFKLDCQKFDKRYELSGFF